MGYVKAQLHRSDDRTDVLETQAYACYVLALAGEPQTPVMNRLAELLRVRKTLHCSAIASRRSVACSGKAGSGGETPSHGAA